MSGAARPARASGRARRRRFLLLAALGLSAAACSREPVAEQFVGTWKSSRLATSPLLMRANGDWEIRSADDRVLQYGVWQVQGRRLLWTIRMNGQVLHDANTILEVDAHSFRLREQDGSVTRFDRLP